MPPKGSVTPAKRNHTQEDRSCKKQKITIPESDDSTADELAEDSEYQEYSKPDKATTRSRKSNNTSSPVSRSTPKPSRSRNPNNVTNLKKARATANKQVKVLKQEKQALEDKERQLREEKLRSQNQVHALRERELASKQQGGQYMQDDAVINQSLNDLSRMIWDWAAAYARKDKIMQHTNPHAAELTLRILYGHEHVSHGALCKRDIDQMLMYQPGGSRVAAQTILEHIVVERFLTRPFSFLALGFQDGTGPSEADLLVLHSRMQESSPDTVLWHTRTLRSLYASHQSQTSSVEPIHEDCFEAERKEVRDYIVGICLNDDNSLLSSLLRAGDDLTAARRRTGLSRIFDVAGKVSLQMWIQGAIPTAHWQGAGCFASGFIPEHTHYNPHLLTQPDLDDESLEGREIDWVVRPCITFRRHHADGSRSADVVALKAQVMLLNLERCRLEATKQLLPPSEPTTVDLPVSVQLPHSVKNHMHDQDLAKGQGDEGDIDTIVVKTPEVVVAETSQRSNLNVVHSEETKETDAHVDQEVSGSDPSYTTQRTPEHNLVTRDPRPANPIIIDLTSEENSQADVGITGGSFQSTERHDQEPQIRIPESEAIQQSREFPDYSIQESQGETIESAETNSDRFLADSGIRSSQQTTWATSPRYTDGVEDTSIQQEESLIKPEDLAQSYGCSDLETTMRPQTQHGERHSPEDTIDSLHSPSCEECLTETQSKHHVVPESEAGDASVEEISREQAQLPENNLHTMGIEADNDPHKHSIEQTHNTQNQDPPNTATSEILAGQISSSENLDPLTEPVTLIDAHPTPLNLADTDSLDKENNIDDVEHGEVLQRSAKDWEDSSDRKILSPYFSKDSIKGSDQREKEVQEPIKEHSALSNPQTEDSGISKELKTMEDVQQPNLVNEDVGNTPDESIGECPER